MEQEIKSCPFCGREAKVKLMDNGCDYYWVECQECGCSMRGDHDSNKAVEDWNDRPPII